MKMKWQFATILAAIYAISPVGATESFKGLTREDVARLNAQLQNGNSRDPNSTAPATNGKVASPPPPLAHDQERLDRLSGGPLAILKMSVGSAQPTGDARKPPAGQLTGVRTIEKPPKGPKLPKRPKPSKRQAKSR
jgi:hypothetical protein